MNACLKSRPSGFSLVELMIGVAIMAILLGVALPGFQSWLNNTQVRNAAEAITNGLQRARAEAVARNTNVTFVLGTQSAWTVGVVAPASVIESRASGEGSKNVTLTVTPGGATTVTYNNLGQAVANADASALLTQVDLVAPGCTHVTSQPCLRVTIGAGGNARMCDPSVSVATNPRGC